jgi:hypothetical protein
MYLFCASQSNHDAAPIGDRLRSDLLKILTQMKGIYERFTGKKLSYDPAHKKAGMKYTTMDYAVGMHPFLG